jgi:pyruvate/2-oxoglutarate dehydrogenase complex dihydrolipoamide acyltransferase (E2) component
MSNELVGNYDIEHVSVRRRMTIDGLDAASPGHRTLALIELDVTRASERIAAMQRAGLRVSLFAFVVACIGKALGEQRELNAIRGGRRIYRFEDVDVNMAVEIATPAGRFPHQVSLRRAQQKTPLEVYAAIEAARSRYADAAAVGREDHRFEVAMRWLAWLPRFVRVGLLRLATRRPLLVKRLSGTTFVTSVGKFARVPGFVIPFAAGPMAVSFALGSVVNKPVIRDAQVVEAMILAMTVIFNHDLVDGGPGARFVARLQALIEGADGLQVLE